jgi:hypothetical protein
MKPTEVLVCVLVLLVQRIYGGTVNATLSVAGQANIYGAGHSAAPAPGGGGGGLRPSSTSSTAYAGATVRLVGFSGTISLGGGSGTYGLEGTSAFATDISSYGGLSGIRADRVGFLAGVFLGSTEPVDPAPPSLDFTASGLGTSFASLSPQLGQVFYIGDGLTGNGSGAVQQFIMPANATGFYFGFADGNGFSGLPGFYGDNTGLVNATFQIQTVPEPGAGLLVCLGLGVSTMKWNAQSRTIRDREP